MNTCKKPINRSMLIYGLVFLTVMCILMSIQSAGMLRASLNRRYTAHMKDVLTYIDHTLDADDLRECIRTGQPSEKYDALQRQVNTMVDDFELMFIYIGIPREDGTFVSIVSSTSDAERAAGDTEEYPIGYVGENFYTAESIKPYLAAMKKPSEFSAFLAKSPEFGHTHTVCKPVVASDGEVVALLCADMNHGELHHNINVYVWSSIALIVLIAIAFGLVVGLWLHRNIMVPLRMLESEARSFAERSRGQRDFAELTFNTPDIRTQNEIQSLSDAITQMSEDMKLYVEEVLAAEQRAESAEVEVENVAKIAYEDSLTHAKSKVAYDAKKEKLSQSVAEGRAEFALIGIELEGADRISEIYGREAGDAYIVNCCKIISDVYQYSSVYRIGDNTFAVFLEGDEYTHRDGLFATLNERLQASRSSTEGEAWEHCSAVTGMTEYLRDAEEDVGQVCRRMEMIISRNKRMRKNTAN